MLLLAVLVVVVAVVTLTLLQRLGQALGAADLSRQRLLDAIDALPACFELYDAEDRLVLTNARARAMYPLIADIADQRPRFEAVVRTHHARGGLGLTAEELEPWIALRKQQRRSGHEPHLMPLPGDRWVRVNERVTREGGVVGLANRRLFELRLAEELARAQRHGLPLALLVVDIDHFKRFNDRHGHPADDAALRQVAQVLRDQARRPVDLAARLGGEEFALLLPHTGADEAHATGERLLQAMAALALPHGDSPTAPYLTLSLGLAVLGPDMGQRELLRQADEALYAAKAQGRNQLVVAGAAP